MKEGWKRVTLGEIATFTRGLTYSKNDEVDFSSNIVLRSNNVNLSDGKLNLDELKYLSESFIVPMDKKVKKGSLLMCMSNGSKAHLGKVALIENGLNYSFGGFMGLVSHDAQLNDRFFWYSLITPSYKDYIFNLSAGANINNIKIKDLQAYTIPLPPLPEQQRIVEYLDSTFAEIDALKAKAAEEVTNAKAMFDAALREEMTPKEGWEEKSLKEITLKISDGSHNPPKGIEQSDFEMLSSKNVRNDIFTFDNPRYLSQQDFEKEDRRTSIEKGDVLLTIVGAGLGDCCVYNFEKKIVFQRSVSVIKPDYDKVQSRFLMYTLQYNYNKIRSESAGAAQKGIYLKQLADYIVSIPALSTQCTIVSRLDSLRSLLTELEQKYAKIAAECDAVKQAILRETFE